MGGHLLVELLLVHDLRLGVLGFVDERLDHPYLVKYLGVRLIEGMRILLRELLDFIVGIGTGQGFFLIEFALFVVGVHVHES